MDISRIVMLSVESGVLAGNPQGDPHVRSLPVYLPEGYGESGARYPVIWVLAPFTSWGQRLFNLQAWDENLPQRLDRLVREGRAAPALLAFPDCFTRYGGSQYLNSSALGRYQDYITQELVPRVDAEFRTLASREHRGVMGHSSGGFGALHLAMHHPDLFGAAACHSGDMGFEWCYRQDIPGAVRALEDLGGIEGFERSFASRDRGADWFAALSVIAMSACYSPNPDSPHGFDLVCDLYTGEIRPEVWERWQAFDPLHSAPRHFDALRSLSLLYFDCGRQDEYHLFLGARRLHRLLAAQDIRHTYEEFEGRHGQINWRYDISLAAMTTALTTHLDTPTRYEQD